jgi:thymidylate synthase
MTFINIEAADISAAWLAMSAKLDTPPHRKSLHAVVHIDDPTTDDSEVRAAVNEILERAGRQSIETVANTIFPAALAASSNDHTELVNRYVRLWPTLRKFPKNRTGTYFGRLIQHPTKDGPFDQIGAVITRIKTERATGSPKQARYEVEVAESDEPWTSTTPIYVPGKDNSSMGFPCLSHCSFQLDYEDRVHLLATYRSQYLLERGYGNYLGLGQLLAHVAKQTELGVGHLTVVAGLAHLDYPVLPVREVIKRFASV